MEELPWQASALGDIYADTATQRERYNKLSLAFLTRFKSQGLFVRSPGRVNLIGEHIDYMGYSVLPMAISNDILIDIKLSKNDTITIANTNPKFGEAEVKIVQDKSGKASVTPLGDERHWANFVVAGIRGIMDNFSGSALAGVNMIVDGNVPAGAGLSSSSALVCASALAFARANKVDVGRTQLAEICCQCERYVGTQGGGMDQAASILSRRGKAMRIDFDPLGSVEVAIPDGAVFVVADSRVEATKFITAAKQYNKRVFECRLGAKILAKKLSIDSWRDIMTLRGVQEKYENGKPENMEASLRALATKAKPLLRDGAAYSVGQLASDLGVESTEDVVLLATKEGSSPDIMRKVVESSAEFEVGNRVRHVFEESARVHAFTSICNSKGTSTQERMRVLGELMDSSHASCRDLFEVSCPELERLVAVCKKAGALGCRLTGAGFGGCTVSLVEAGSAKAFLEAIRKEYYGGMGLSESELDAVSFISPPGQGAMTIHDSQLGDNN